MVQNTEVNIIDQNNSDESQNIQLHANNEGNFSLPEGHFVGDADISRDGQDLVLEYSDHSYNVENYFAEDQDTLVEDSAGGVLTHGLVNSFMHSSPEYAQASSMTDESPVGAVEEIKGASTVTHLDGSTEDLTLGTPIYQGDVIQTSGDGAVNIVFIDETSMAISADAKIAVDNYKFDATTESGETNLSVLRGVFVYTSGLIGRDDPDDVEIQTPVGSIGIRGTIIAGNINPAGQSEISVLEGAIVVKNGAGETTLSQQYETVTLSGFQNAMEYKGVEAANDIGKTYGSVSDVLPKLFSSINDASTEEEIKLEQQKEESPENSTDIQESEEVDAAAQDNQTTDETVAPVVVPLEIIEDVVGFGATPSPVLKAIITETINSPTVKSVTTSSQTIGQSIPQEILYQPPKIFDTKEVLVNFRPVFEGTAANTVIGSVTLKDYPVGTTVAFDVGGTAVTTTTEYTIVQVGTRFDIQINAATGLGFGGSIGTANIIVQLPGSITLTPVGTLSPTIQDAAVNLNATGGLSYHVANGGFVLAENAENVKDFDGDNTQDTVSVASGSVLISGAPVLTGGYTSVDSIGDFNNDGYTDIVAGNSAAGTVTVVEYLNPSVTTIPYTGSPGDGFGYDVSGAGDFNGDGYSDFVYSAPDSNANNGSLFIEYGGGAGTLQVNGIGGSRLGQTITSIGDINGDGLTDLLATTALNESYVIFGQNATGAQTVTATGFNISTSGAEIMIGANAAGDINGDGYDDFAVTFENATDTDTYVVYGHSTGFTDLTLAQLENPEIALKIHQSGSADAANPYSHYQVTALGDINGDGFDDIQLGTVNSATGASVNQYIVYGQIGGNNVPYAVDGTATDGSGAVGTADGVLSATANGQSLVGDVRFIDANRTDLSMQGGGSNNAFEINNNSFRSIDGGNGFDTIRVMGGGASFDFSGVNFEQIQQVEEIRFGGTGQTITLTSENLFNLMKSSDNGELRISGGGNIVFDVANPGAGGGQVDDPREVLEAGGGGTANYAGNTTLDGHNYNTYNVGSYTLYIEADPATTINYV